MTLRSSGSGARSNDFSGSRLRGKVQWIQPSNWPAPIPTGSRSGARAMPRGIFWQMNRRGAARGRCFGLVALPCRLRRIWHRRPGRARPSCTAHSRGLNSRASCKQNRNAGDLQLVKAPCPRGSPPSGSAWRNCTQRHFLEIPAVGGRGSGNVRRDTPNRSTLGTERATVSGPRPCRAHSRPQSPRSF